MRVAVLKVCSGQEIRADHLEALTTRFVASQHQGGGLFRFVQTNPDVRATATGILGGNGCRYEAGTGLIQSAILCLRPSDRTPGAALP